jgi:hypothetical protein
MALRTPAQKAANAAAMKAQLEAPPVNAKEPGIKLADAATMLGVCYDTARKLIREDGGFWCVGNGCREHMRTSLSTIRRIKESRRRVQSPRPYMGHGGRN